MSATQFIGCVPSQPLGFKNYYRVVFDVSKEVLWTSYSDKLNYVYDHLQDTGLIQTFSPNPVTDGDSVMTVDCYTPFADAGSQSIAEGVRRMEMIAGSAIDLGTSAVRSIQKLSGGVGDVTSGAQDRQDTTDETNQKNQADDPFQKFEDLLSGLGHFGTLAIFGLIAYAAITVARGVSK